MHRQNKKKFHTTGKKYELVRYLHGAYFPPVQSKNLKVINNKQFLTWPGLDANNCFKNIPTHVMAIVKVHMKQETQHLKPTKIKPPQ